MHLEIGYDTKSDSYRNLCTINYVLGKRWKESCERRRKDSYLLIRRS